MDWSVLTDPEANLGDDARAELARLDPDARNALSQELGTIVNKKLEAMIRPWFSRGSHDWADVDVCAAEMRDGALVLHFIADHYNYNFAQSGSDWADHYVFVGEACLAGGKLDLKTLVVERQVHVSEHESEHYERRKIIDAARSELRAKLRAEEARRRAATEAGAAANPNVTPGDPARVEWERLMAAGAQCLKVRKRAKAIEHYEAAVKLAETFHPHGLDLGRTLFQLASVLSVLSWRRAEYPLTRALAILEENLPADDPEVIAACRGLIRVHLEKKEGARAERLIRQFLPIVERARGLLHEETSTLLFSLGGALRLQRKHAEADEVYTRYLKAAEAAWGPRDLRVTDIVEAMAANFLEQGNVSKAESLYRRALTVREDWDLDLEGRYREGHYWEGRFPPPRQLNSVLSALADMLTKLARYEEAEKLLRRLLDRAENRSIAAGNLGAVLRKMGRADEADKIERDVDEELTAFYKMWRGD